MSKLLVTVVAAALLATLTPAPASGVTYDKLAYLTFTAPVQIPGATLAAGTYQFHLTNPDTSRNVVQVLSHDGAIVYSMFHTIPDSRISVTTEPTVTFKETPAGVPPAVRSLFYGYEHRGYEFVYGKGEPNLIPEAVAQPPIFYTPNPAPSAHVAVIEPPAEVEAPVLAAEPIEPLPEPVAEAAPVELPKTASPVPLLAVGGVGFFMAGLGLALLRRRVS